MLTPTKESTFRYNFGSIATREAIQIIDIKFKKYFKTTTIIFQQRYLSVNMKSTPPVKHPLIFDSVTVKMLYKINAFLLSVTGVYQTL